MVSLSSYKGVFFIFPRLQINQFEGVIIFILSFQIFSSKLGII
ncbi:hypothetical protein ED5_2158 [Enterobacter roggenkampii]|nr:hypothetical protein ED5_2158 [Enterobacter roggenkampii]